MKLMIGNEIWVFLKKEFMSNIGDIFGLLVEVTDDSLYVQSLNPDRVKIYVIPRENVAYCTTDTFPQSDGQVIESTQPPVLAPEPEIVQPQEEAAIDRLNVYVNEQQVASIPVPPTFPIHEWSEKILRAIMGNPDVKCALAGKIQKEIKYYPGEVYITIDNIVPPSQMPEQEKNTFSMGGSPSTEYLNPSQMVQRLNKVGGGGNDDQSNM